MVRSTMSVENDVRRQYNRRVLFCIRIKGAALVIGLWDLFIHVAALFALIFIFGRGTGPNTQISSISNRYNRPLVPIVDSSVDSATPNLLSEHRNFLSSNLLLHRILERRNATHPPMELNARQFYTNMDPMTLKWMRTLSQQDKCIVFFIIFSATLLILVHLWGVLTNKPSYIVPYFLIKVFNVIISIMSILGFYAYLPDINGWLRAQPDFPLKHSLLELDSQTLQMVVFTFLLFIVLAKLYIAAIIWYCYGYITAMNIARAIGTIDLTETITGEMYSPPKYDEAIKSHADQEENYAPPPYTPLLSS